MVFNIPSPPHLSPPSDKFRHHFIYILGVLILWYGGTLAMQGQDGLTPGREEGQISS